MNDAPAEAPAEPVLTVASAMLDAPAPAAAPADPAIVPDPAAPPDADPAAAPEAPESVPLPGKDATPEQWAEFYGKIGRPETPEAYEMTIPEGDDGTFAKAVAPLLHKVGITGPQAKELSEGWNQMKIDAEAQMASIEKAQIAALDAQNRAEAVALKNEWGQQHDANIHFAKLGIQQFVPKEQAAGVISAIESVLGYKGTIQMMHAIGKGLGEHDAAGLGTVGTGVATKTAAEVLYGNNG